MFGHFKKSASILTDQDTQMVGNDRLLATICNAEWHHWSLRFSYNDEEEVKINVISYTI